jgi:Fic family protein
MNDPQIRLDQRLAARLAAKKAQLDERRPLPAATVRALQDHLRVVLTYHSNAIEGNTLTLRETELALEYGMTADNHSLREYLEATNHAKAVAQLPQLIDSGIPITIDTVLSLHAVVMHELLPTAGHFRTASAHIRGVGMRLPPAQQVPDLMTQWIAWVNYTGDPYDPIVRAAIAHHDFEAIHPFADGNGRVGRLLLTMMLIRDGYPPALLLREWRHGYMQALVYANGGNHTPLANLIGRAVEGGLDLYLEACAATPEAEYQRLADLAPQTGYTTAHLGWLIREGHLDAVKRGGRWYSTLAAVQHYRREVEEGRIPRGRPPRTPDELPPSPSNI